MLAIIGYAAVAFGLIWFTAGQYLKNQQHLVLGAVAIGLLCALGQVNRTHMFYPFDRWAMYSTSVVPRAIELYEVTDAGGNRYHYPFVDLAFSSPRAFMARITQLIGHCRCTKEDRIIDTVFASLAQLHLSQRQGTLAIVEIAAFEVRLSDGSRRLRYLWRPSDPRR